MKKINFAIPESMIKEVRRLSEKSGISKSKIYRNAISEYVGAVKKNGLKYLLKRGE